jgi:hypothetical protein
MTRNEREAHAALCSTEWQRLRAGFAVQGPYPRRQRARVWRWLLAFLVVGAVIRAVIGALS